MTLIVEVALRMTLLIPILVILSIEWLSQEASFFQEPVLLIKTINLKLNTTHLWIVNESRKMANKAKATCQAKKRTANMVSMCSAPMCSSTMFMPSIDA